MGSGKSREVWLGRDQGVEQHSQLTRDDVRLDADHKAWLHSRVRVGSRVGECLSQSKQSRICCTDFWILATTRTTPLPPDNLVFSEARRGFYTIAAAMPRVRAPAASAAQPSPFKSPVKYDYTCNQMSSAHY